MTHNFVSPSDQQCALYRGWGGGGGEGLQRIAPNHSPCPELIMTYLRAKLKLILLINTTFPVKTKTNISFKSHNSNGPSINLIEPTFKQQVADLSKVIS